MAHDLVVACDHAGVQLKEDVKGLGYDILDLGTHSEESVDYPDMARAVADALKEGTKVGLLICGSGIGMSIAANRFKFIRAALCRTLEDVRLARAHNDANVLVLGARIEADVDIEQMLTTFMTTPFEGGRHQRRVEKLGEMG